MIRSRSEVPPKNDAILLSFEIVVSREDLPDCDRSPGAALRRRAAEGESTIAVMNRRAADRDGLRFGAWLRHCRSGIHAVCEFVVTRVARFPVLAAAYLFSTTALGAQSQTLAFPGAEGFGRFATGGRGGTVYHVTNLNDNGPGSFRDAVSVPNRTVIFDVGGIIRIDRRISMSPNLTIAGQTAPDYGITIYGNGVSFSGANNAIVRHMRFRMGIHGDRGKDAVTIANGHDMIFDHVSVSWGRDETFSISGPVTNVTIQDSIVAQGLQPHSAGGLIQTPGGVSILRTLYIDNHTRNPKVKGVNQFVNNVVYNWGGGGCYILGDSENPSYANVVSNYFIDGPSSRAAAFSRGNLNFHIYAAGNVLDANRDGILEGSDIPQTAYGTVDWRTTPYPYPAITTFTPLEGCKVIASRAGASLHRDPVDEQLLKELASGGTLGETISRETESPMTGPGQICGGSAPRDSDRDGLPDYWEFSVGLNPKDPADGRRIVADGCTELEHYLNWLASPHVVTSSNQPADVDLRQFTSGFANRRPVYRLSNPSNGEVSLVQGHAARFTPAKNFVGRGAFQFAVADSDGSRFTNTVSVLISKQAIPLK